MSMQAFIARIIPNSDYDRNENKIKNIHETVEKNSMVFGLWWPDMSRRICQNKNHC